MNEHNQLDGRMLHFNVQRLLRAAKRMALDIRCDNIHKLKFLLERLCEDFQLLEKSGLSIPDDRIAQYRREIRFLLDTTTKKQEDIEHEMPSVADKAKSFDLPTCNIEKTSEEQKESARFDEDVNLTRLKQHTKAQHAMHMRRFLLGQKQQPGLSNNANGQNENLDTMLARQQEKQDEMAKEFLKMTLALKNSALNAGEIIRKDIQALDRVDKLSDDNRAKLERESVILARAAYRSCCDCGLVCVVFMTIITFIVMVVFMRLFPKSQSSAVNENYETQIGYNNPVPNINNREL